MALQLGALRDALLAANVPPDKADRAAEEAAGYETRLASLDAKLTIVLWAGGLLFAAILASQAVLWTGMGRIEGSLAAIGTQLTHIEQLVASAARQ
jgi:hypothetical protein